MIAFDWDFPFRIFIFVNYIIKVFNQRLNWNRFMHVACGVFIRYSWIMVAIFRRFVNHFLSNAHIIASKPTWLCCVACILLDQPIYREIAAERGKNIYCIRLRFRISRPPPYIYPTFESIKNNTYDKYRMFVFANRVALWTSSKYSIQSYSYKAPYPAEQLE